MMPITSRHPRVVGYNVRGAVETEHHVIVVHEVANIGTDRNALSDMTNQAGDALGVEALDAVADKGYYKGVEIVACEDDGITVTLPKIGRRLPRRVDGSIAARSSMTPKRTCMFVRPTKIPRHA